MKRLTKRLNDGTELCIDVCGEQCVDGYTWCPKCKPFTDVMKKLAEYEDAEEQGKLIILPCKVGDAVYSVECDRIEKFIASHFDVCLKSIYALQGDFFIGEMGHTVFATKEEAEQALAKMKEV